MSGGSFDWDRLKVFHAVADAGSINAATRNLGMSYGKVSSDLDELERALGHRLFDRSSRGLELTTVGEEILRTARSIADAVQAITDRAIERDPDQIVICAREGIASYWLARKLPDLLLVQPEARIHLKVMPTTPNLVDGDGDIAIQFEQPSSSKIVSRQLGWLHYLLYASPDYIREHGEPKKLSDLQQHRCLRLSGQEYQTEMWLKKAIAWADILPRTVTTDASTVLVEACASGAGIAVMPSYVSQVESRVTPLLAIKPLSSVRVWMTYTDRLRNLEASHPVLHWLRSCFDPVTNPCFREIYVPPARGTPMIEIANDDQPAAADEGQTRSFDRR
jgi:molybdate transport repressor ModE-like protein